MKDKFWLESFLDILLPMLIFILSLVILVFVIIFSGNRRGEKESEYIQLEQVTYRIMVDKNTGVLYYRYNSGITPIYNADGTLKLYEETE
jgi:hypothetical protein